MTHNDMQHSSPYHIKLTELDPKMAYLLIWQVILLPDI